MIKHNWKYILASNSPRRKELLGGLGIDFKVKVLKDIDESYPETLPAAEVAEYIAQKKAAPYKQLISGNEMVITADTVVVADNEIMGKPADEADAKRMLMKLSDQTHQVYTGVCLLTRQHDMRHFSVKTDVTFKKLTEEEIDYYIENYHPMDKAGAYGIQEWIGYIGVTGLNGSYFNVMGLPVQRIYDEIQKLGNEA